jgi:hypothetical protein
VSADADTPTAVTAAAFGDAQVAIVAGLVFAVVAMGMLAVRPIRQLRHQT